MNSKRHLEKQSMQAYQEALSRWGSHPEVRGIDLGFLSRNGRRMETVVVRIHSRTPRQNAKILEIPQKFGDVAVEVIQGSYRMEACPSPSPRRQRLDPIQPGISVGPTSTGAGTLGVLVRDAETDQLALLSSAHVLAGCPPTGGKPKIFQPAPDDCGSPKANLVAKLNRWILGPAGDAAVAFFNDSRKLSVEQFDSGAVIGSARMANLGEIVEKSGRTTGVTRGQIDGIGTYFLECGGRIGIEGFRVVPEEGADPSKELTFAGDSGSVWYAVSSQEGLGLHFAGEDSDEDQEYALACHLPRVLDELKIVLF